MAFSSGDTPSPRSPLTGGFTRSHPLCQTAPLGSASRGHPQPGRPQAVPPRVSFPWVPAPRHDRLFPLAVGRTERTTFETCSKRSPKGSALPHRAAVPPPPPHGPPTQIPSERKTAPLSPAKRCSGTSAALPGGREARDGVRQPKPEQNGGRGRRGAELPLSALCLPARTRSPVPPFTPRLIDAAKLKHAGRYGAQMN